MRAFFRVVGQQISDEFTAMGTIERKGRNDHTRKQQQHTRKHKTRIAGKHSSQQERTTQQAHGTGDDGTLLIVPFLCALIISANARQP